MSHYRIYEIDKRSLNYEDRITSDTFIESETDFSPLGEYFYDADQGVDYVKDVADFCSMFKLTAKDMIKQTVTDYDDNEAEYPCYGFKVTREMIEVIEDLIKENLIKIQKLVAEKLADFTLIIPTKGEKSSWLTMSKIRSCTRIDGMRFYLCETNGPGSIYDIAFFHHFLLDNEGETLWINGVVGYKT